MHALWVVIPLLAGPLVLATLTLVLVAYERRQTVCSPSGDQPVRPEQPVDAIGSVGPDVEGRVFGADPADWETPEGQRLLGQMLHLLDGGSLRIVPDAQGDEGEGSDQGGEV